MPQCGTGVIILNEILCTIQENMTPLSDSNISFVVCTIQENMTPLSDSKNRTMEVELLDDIIADEPVRTPGGTLRMKIRVKGSSTKITGSGSKNTSTLKANSSMNVTPRAKKQLGKCKLQVS